MKTKRGNVEIIFMLIVIILLFVLTFSVYILYIQITTYVIPVKQDIFYIVQNAYLSLNKDGLEYSDYEINNYNLTKRVNEILKLNYPKCELKTIYYIKSSNRVHVQVCVNIKPIILSGYIGDLKLNITDNIKLKMMEVKK